MKLLILLVLVSSTLFAGFFNESAEEEKAEFMENDRLCKLFTQKVKAYKKDLRTDFFAKTTLASYEHRASLFCKKAQKEESELKITTPSLDTNITDKNKTAIL